MPASAQDALFFRLGVAHIRDAMAAADVVRALLRLAVERRAPLADDPETAVYRLVNGTPMDCPG